MNLLFTKVTVVLNFLFGLSMPFTHVVGYIAGGIAFLLTWDLWKRLRYEKFFFWLKVFMVYGFLRALFSNEPSVGYATMLGYLTQWIFPFILGYAIADTSSFKKSFWIYYITFSILVFVSFLAFFGLFPKNFGEFEFAKEGLLKGGRSHIALAALCLLSSFFTLGNFMYNSELKGYKKNLFIFMMIFFLGAILLTGSRGYYMAALAVYSVFMVVYIARSKIVGLQWVVAGIFGIVLMITALYFVSPTIQARMHRTNAKDGSVQERLSLYKVALWEIKSSPVFGYGPGQGTRQEKFYKMLPPEMQSVARHPHLHSFYLHFTAEFGMLGFLILFFIFYTWLKEVWKMHVLSTGFYKAVSFGLFWGLIGIMLGDSLDTLLRGPGVAMELFWFTGLIMGQRNFNS